MRRRSPVRTRGSKTRAPKKKTPARRRAAEHSSFFRHHALNGADHDPKPVVTLDPSPNFASRQNEIIRTLVLHNTDGPLAPSLRRLKDPAAQVSAHYVVDRNGRIYQLVDDSHTAWHAGNRQVNQRSIGVEIVAWKTAPGMTAEQESALVQLCRFITSEYAVPREFVVPHRSIKATECPGWVWRTDADLETWKAAHLPE